MWEGTDEFTFYIGNINRKINEIESYNLISSYLIVLYKEIRGKRLVEYLIKILILYIDENNNFFNFYK